MQKKIRNQIFQKKSTLKIKFNISTLNWFRITSYISYLFIPKNLNDLIYFCQKKPKKFKIKILGNGSNILLKNQNKYTVFIKLGNNFKKLLYIKNNIIQTGAATFDTFIAQFSAQNSISGMEFLATIPGSIGGAIIMNAGANNCKTCNILLSAQAINVYNGKIKTFLNKDFDFIYRGNNINKNWLFISTRLQGQKRNKKIIMNNIKYVNNYRYKNQPIGLKTCGSTFKNMYGLKAWKLISFCNLRGFKLGGAKFSNHHCNFIINSNGSFNDIKTLIKTAKKKIKKKYGVNLEIEIQII